MISPRAKRLYVISATIALSVLILGMSLLAPILSTAEDFSIYNTGWNGTSALAKSARSAGRLVPTFTIAATDSNLEVVHLPLDSFQLDPDSSSLIIIGPSKPFTPSEGKLVGDFVRKGGHLLLADDFGSGNSLLRAMNATSEFSGYLLLDLAYEKQPEFSVCFDFNSDNNVTMGVTTVLMNYPTTVVPGRNTTVLARSSIASYEDVNQDRLRTWSDPIGPFPVIAIERLGLGQILLISDPSIFINGMLKQAQNELLANNSMYFLSGSSENVFFDESHRNYFDPVSISILAIGQMSAEAKIAVVAIMTFVLLSLLTEYPRMASRRIFNRIARLWHGVFGRLFQKKKVPETTERLTDDELIVAVMERHPEWRRSMLRMLLAQAEYHRKTKGW